MPQPIRSKFTDKSDKLILEDELQRIILVGALECQDIVTGWFSEKFMNIILLYFKKKIEMLY